jgi:mono/diheme cytochrome c family protein
MGFGLAACPNQPTPETPEPIEEGAGGGMGEEPPAEGGAAGGETPAPEPAPEPASTAFADQATEGQKLYGENCAKCHGDAGQGGKAPKVVGLKEGALPLDPPKGAKVRKTKFETVADIADFVVKNMPPGKGGSLSTDQYLAILAFDLKANGIDLKDKKLDLELAKTLKVPR